MYICSCNESALFQESTIGKIKSRGKNCFTVYEIKICELFQSSSFVSRLESLCDTVVHVDSFAGSDKEKNPAFKEYHGEFKVTCLIWPDCLH